MGILSDIAARASSWAVRNRHRLPVPVNRLIDDVAKNPDGRMARLASFVLGGTNARNIPQPTIAPHGDIRLYVGPTNYAAQGYLWARALEADDPSLAARNMAVELPGGFGFPADSHVPVSVYNASTAWQQAELAAVRGYTHVLIEAQRPLFGSLFLRDVGAEIAALQASGVSLAHLCHGTDIRSPRRHLAQNAWSPYADDAASTAALQAVADANLALLERTDLPVFVSTPDLLLDAPSGHWCPVVVDVEAWTGGRELLTNPLPIVAHIPSMGPVKGTQLIEATVRRLHDEGVLEYRNITGVAARDMPAMIGDADIVLDQFRLGSYGVAACEAMAAGRVVVGHIDEQARAAVAQATSIELPILEATVDTLEMVLRRLIDDHGAMRRAAAAGTAFVSAVHNGRLSARVLREHWIDQA